MEVESAVSRERMYDAIKGKFDSRIAETLLAPNAWITGGDGPFHAKLASLVNEAAPRLKVDVKTKEE